MFRKLQPIENPITVFIDGKEHLAEPNETVAAVLCRLPDLWSRKTAVSKAKRAPYCMMGVCFDCLAKVDGISSVQTCLTVVREGMRIERQIGAREVAV